jgi:uncharacterized protein (DUF58 family)
VTLRPSPHAFALASLLAWMLFLGVLADRAELFVAAIPLAVGFLSARGDRRPPHFTLRQEVSADRLAEGDRVVVTIALQAVDPVPMVEVLAGLPALVEVTTGNNRVVRGVVADGEASWSYELVCPARGRFDLGVFHLRFWDLAGLTLIEARIAEPKPIAVYPYVARIRQAPRPLRTQHSFGNYVSPRLGEGIEPGDTRPFLPGDRIRRINWRATSRRGQLYVNQFHEERNADVVLLLDTLSESGAPPYSTIDLCVRAAAALANAYLSRKDRVGFLEFGGFLRRIDPATGQRQAQALVDALLPAATHFSYVVPQLDVLPPRVLPKRALIVALSPLLDERFTKALLDLAARGFDVIVLAVSPIEPTRRIVPPGFPQDLALRLWALEWEATTEKLRASGLEVLPWHADTSLEAALTPLARSRPRWAARR